MIKKETLKEILKEAYSEFFNDKVLKLSASLSYYTIFSISPMLIVIISLCGIFLGKQAIEGQIYDQIKGFVGNDAAIQIQSMIKSVGATKGNYVATILGLITLLIGATGVFSEIQDSINFIWGIKAKPKRGVLKIFINRITSFSIVLGMGFILMVSLAFNGILAAFSSKISHYFPDSTIQLAYVLNFCLTFIVLNILFAVIFKVLPDAYIKWRDVIIGSMVTTILFMLGKFLIGMYLGMSNINVTYGAAASLVIILLWVYYSSIILYIGAEFTQVYADKAGSGVIPKEYAVFIKNKEVVYEKLI